MPLAAYSVPSCLKPLGASWIILSSIILLFFSFVDFLLQVEAVIVTNLARETVVVILTGTAMVTRALTPGVVVETDQDRQVSQVEDGVVLAEVVVTSPSTLTELKIPVAEEGISHSRMALGTKTT